MSKCFLCVALHLTVLLSANCLFAGEECIADDAQGRCRLLSACQPLLIEIKNAGTPMPARVRRRLQALTCGFQADQPLVCCTAPYTNMDNRETEIINRPPTMSHGMGVSFNGHDGERHQNNDFGNSWGIDDEDCTNNNQYRPGVPTNIPNINNNNGDSSNSDEKEIIPDVRRHPNLPLLPTACGFIESDRIWGGNRTRLYEMPWMVLIAYESARGTTLSCGGTLINEWYVLTAAHCVSFLGTRLSLAGVVLGEYDVRSDPDCERVEGELNCAPKVRNVTIDTVIPHPGYSPQNLFDDIALVRLSQPADFKLDSMKPICLPTSPELQSESLEDVQGVVAGWGATEDGLQSPVLLSVQLPIVANKDCQEAYNGSPHIYDRQMCAGGVQDKDSCGGDSGGPLMYPGQVGPGGVKYVQRGIVSYGSKRCGIGGFPGVYTRVAYYMDWILNNIH